MKTLWIGCAAIGLAMSGSVRAAPTTLSVLNASVAPGGSAAVALRIAAQGKENALSFSLAYDAAKLTFTGASLGSGALGASLVTNPVQAPSGRIGVVISLPVNQNLVAGTLELLKVTFTAGSFPGGVALGFANSPAPKSISDTLGNDLQCEFVDGTVTIQGAQAPVITAHPLSKTLNPGATAVFSVTATGAAPLSYQWRKNGVNLSGRTGSTLTLNNVQSADAGSYTVVISNAAGSATSNAAVLTVLALSNTAPAISGIPDQMITQDGVVTIRFTINDAETSPTALTLTAVSSNPSLISAPNIAFGGTGPDRTAALIPAANQIGETTVTITVTDAGGLSAKSSFEVKVTARSVVPTPGGDGGTIVFNNRVPGMIDARVTLPDGTGVGEGWTAELLAGPEGGTLMPVPATTTFRTSIPAAMGYVNSVTVSVPNVTPGAKATVVMRAFNGTTFDRSTIRGQSQPIIVVLGGNGIPPSLPASLDGLQGFTVRPVQSSNPSAPPTEAGGGGTVTFNNRLPGLIDARVVAADGTGLGAGWTAELLAGSEATPLMPVTPTTTFRTTSAAAMGYVVGVGVIVPNVAPGAKAILVMRAFNGETFDSSTLRGQSKPITVVLGGAGSPPSLPANLEGLEGFTVGPAQPSNSPIPPTNPLTGNSFVTRQLPGIYVPGVKLIVNLKATPSAGTVNYLVQDQPPQGWVLGPISDSGSYDANTRKVKWGPFFDANSRALTYEITAPPSETGEKTFSGSASADGVSSVIAGANKISAAPPYHPADSSPPDGLLTGEEVTAYGAAWKKNQTWPIPPNPILDDYVTRAGFLWKRGEAYMIDPSIPAPPLYWVNTPAKAGLQAFRVSAQQTPGGSAIGLLSPLFVPGESLVVGILVQPAPDVSAYAVREQLPKGWKVTQVNDDGVFDPQSGQLKWGPYFDSQVRQLHYEAITAEEHVETAVFQGTVSFDGASILIGGQRQSRASCRLAALKELPNGQFQLQVTGGRDRRWVIEASSNLRDWLPLSTAVSLDGTLQFRDPSNETEQHKFYRAVAQ